MQATDPITIVDALNPEELLEELAELARKARAVRILLNAARARQRGLRRLVPAGHQADRQEPPGG